MPSPQTVRLDGPFPMTRGGVLPEVELAWECWGQPNAARDNAVLLFTGLSPSAHAAASAADPAPGWWDYMIGPGRPLDTDRLWVICFNSLGSCFGSTGPASIDPRNGEPYRLRFPELTVEDIARSAHAALRMLGVDRLHAVVGASLGGMAALAYAVLFPDAVEQLVSISAAAHATPAAIATRSLQREIIRNDPAWQGGAYPPGGGPVEGMRLARKLGLMSYRSAAEWDARFGRDRLALEGADLPPFGIEFQVESYLDANARKFIGCFDANSYLYLSRAMDWFDVADHGGSLAAGLGKVRADRSLVVGVETDALFPLHQQRELATALQAAGREVVFHALPSVQGHDAFLVDREPFAAVVADFLAPAASSVGCAGRAAAC